MDNIISPRQGLFLGRHQEFQSFMDNFNKYALFGIIGIAGIGKTTLMEKISRITAEKKYKTAWIFCSERLKFDRFLYQINNWLKKFENNTFEPLLKSDHAVADDKINKVIEILSKEKIILCIDDFHLVNDKAINSFLLKAAEKLENTKILFTSRKSICLDPDNPVDYWHVNLQGFSKDTGAEFLKHLLLTGGEEKVNMSLALKASELTEGHILSLRTLATLVIRGISLETALKEWNTTKGKIGGHLLSVFKKNLTLSELKTLQALSVFNRPPEKKDLNWVLSSLDIKENFDSILKSLTDLFIVKITEFNKLFLHHILRDYILDHTPDTIKKKIALLCAENFKLKSSLEDSLEAVYHLITAGEFLKAAELLGKIQEPMFDQGTRSELSTLINILSKNLETLPVNLKIMEAKILIPLGKVAQAKNILNELIEEAETTEEKLEIHKQLGTCQVTMGDNEEAMKDFIKCLDLAEKLNNKSEINMAHWMTGCILSNQRKPIEALSKFKMCLMDCTEESLKAKVLSSMGVTLTSLDRYDQAYEALQEAALLFESQKNLPMLTFTRCNISHLLIKKGEIPDAMKFSEESLETALTLGDSRLIHYALKNLGSIYECLGDLGKASLYFEKSMLLAEKFGNPHLIAAMHINTGRCYMEKGDYKEALDNFEKALELYEHIGDSQMTGAALVKKAALLSNTGEYDEALHILLKAEEMQKRSDDKFEMANLLITRGNILKDRGNYAQAKEAFNQALKIYNQIESITGLARVYHQTASLSFMEEDYESARKRYIFALRLAKKAGLNQLQETIISGLAEIYIRKGQHNKAYNHIKSAMYLSEKTKSKKSKSYLYSQIGKFLSIRGENEKAIEFLENARILKIETGDQRGLARVCSILGDLYYKTGQFESALKEYTEGLKISEEKRYLTMRINLKINIGKTHAALNNSQDAIHHLRSSLTLMSEIKEDHFLSSLAHGFLNKLFSKRNMNEKAKFHLKRFENNRKKLSPEKQTIVDALISD
jgi:tetratricopeptide (TPR) repeat protein